MSFSWREYNLIKPVTAHRIRGQGMRIVIVVALAIVVGACQTGPSYLIHKTGSSYTQRINASDACKIAALKDVPQTNAIASTPGYYNPGYTTCTSFGCTTVGGGYTPGSTYSYDPNQSLRDRQINRCLNRKGYTLVEKPLCISEADKAKALAERRQPQLPADQIKCVSGDPL